MLLYGYTGDFKQPELFEIIKKKYWKEEKNEIRNGKLLRYFHSVWS